MLNRRILRVKAYKTIYSRAENPDMSVDEALTAFEASCESTRSLYLLMLGIIPWVTAEAKRRIEAAKLKFNLTEEDLNPNLKFTGNGISRILEEDPDFNKALSKRKLSWENQDALVRRLFDTMSAKDYYKAYMESSESSLKEDAALFVNFFEQEFSDPNEEFVEAEDIRKILEDQSLWWNDDLAYALTCCCDTLKSLAAGESWSLPPLYRSEMMAPKPGQIIESDKAFAYGIIRSAIACYDKYLPLVASASSKWEMDRLCATDTVLIILGLAEAKSMPAIPIQVTINEYVDIAKLYSTPKSYVFVNGMLDSLIKKLIEEGEIVKK